MKRPKHFIHRCIVLIALSATMLLQSCNEKPSTKLATFESDESHKISTHLNFRNDPANFQFAVMGDRAGGHRPMVFSASLDMLNLLQPEFVVNVGDLIEGYVNDEGILKSQWADVDEKLSRLHMPFFYVPGNHDVNFDPSEEVWFSRQKSKRSYSHFIYKDVLFLMISTEDPPKQDVSEEMAENYARVKAGQTTSEERRKIVAELEDWAGQVSISDEQVDYFKNVLETNMEVRWTFAFMHTPAWEQTDPGNFENIEELLEGRPYTIFAGHTHNYKYTYRNERDYITMGTTGGAVPGSGIGNMDHVAWVTMTAKGPIVSNLLLNGIMDKRGATPVLEEFLLFKPRQITRKGETLGLMSVPNFRDMGGYENVDGATIKSGLLYRANQLSGVRPDDMKKISDLKLQNAFDLRTEAERTARADELPPNVNYVVLDVLADAEQANPAVLEELMKNPEQANEALGSGKAEAGFIESYRQFVSLPSAQKAYRNLFLSLGDEKQLPAVFHCTTGKDRTGWAAAAFLTLLKVPYEVVLEDYLRSNDYIIPLYQKHIDAFVEGGGDRNIPMAILGVKKEYLEAAFDEMRNKYGNIESYFSEGLGINEQQQKDIKSRFLN